MKPDTEWGLSRPSSMRLGESSANYLRDAILAGYLERGQRLIIRELAEDLGVSTMPVREALIALDSEGLVVSEPHRGFQVAEIPRRDIEDVFAVHAHIAGLLAERAVIEGPGDLADRLLVIQDRLDRLCEAYKRQPDLADQIQQLNHQFHREINRASVSNRLHWFLKAATRYVPRHFYLVVPGWVTVTHQGHTPIVEAIANTDGQLARKLAEAHVLEAGELVVKHLDLTGFWEPK